MLGVHKAVHEPLKACWKNKISDVYSQSIQIFTICEICLRDENKKEKGQPMQSIFFVFKTRSIACQISSHSRAAYPLLFDILYVNIVYLILVYLQQLI